MKFYVFLFYQLSYHSLKNQQHKVIYLIGVSIVLQLNAEYLAINKLNRIINIFFMFTFILRFDVFLNLLLSH